MISRSWSTALLIMPLDLCRSGIVCKRSYAALRYCGQVTWLYYPLGDVFIRGRRLACRNISILNWCWNQTICTKTQYHSPFAFHQQSIVAKVSSCQLHLIKKRKEQWLFEHCTVLTEGSLECLTSGQAEKLHNGLGRSLNMLTKTQPPWKKTGQTSVKKLYDFNRPCAFQQCGKKLLQAQHNQLYPPVGPNTCRTCRYCYRNCSGRTSLCYILF